MAREKMAYLVKSILIISLFFGCLSFGVFVTTAESASEPYKVGLSATVTGGAAVSCGCRA